MINAGISSLVERVRRVIFTHGAYMHVCKTSLHYKFTKNGIHFTISNINS